MGEVRVVRSSGLVLDWDGRTTDRSRNHHVLTNHGAVSVRGKYGKGMLFNGTDAYIDCGNDSSLDITDAITIEAWVKPISIDNFTNIQIARKRLAYFLGFQENGTQLTMSVTIGGTAKETDTLITKADYEDGSWHHIVGTYDGENFKVYSDSNLLESQPQTGDIDITTNILAIGCYGPGWSEFFNGTIDGVKIYNRALSAAEILAHYKSKGYLSGLVESPVKIV